MIRLLPNPILTERLTIRWHHPDFAPVVNAAIRESFPELNQWMGWADHIPTLEESVRRSTSAAALAAAGEEFGMMAFESSSGEFVLACGLHPKDKDVPSFEIGYWGRKGFGGRGYATEVARAVTEAAFEYLGARRVEIRCDVLNVRSRAVAERCGYRLEGILENECLGPSGELRTTAIYGRTS